MTDDEIMALFMPHFIEPVERLKAGKRLVHYTNADTAYKIISGGQVWLRNSHLMNDYSEMRHGLSCLQSAWGSESGQILKKWLEKEWPGICQQLETTFDAHSDSMTNGTFLMSLSEHEDEEDNYGRLSMWRAYGGRNGVALVFNPNVFLSDADALHVYSTPVVYKDVEGFGYWFESWVGGLISAEEQLKSLDRETVFSNFFYSFRTFVLATKHPGFHEEKEWRVFHSPAIDGASPWLHYDVETVGGSPQHVVKVDLRDDEKAGVVGLEPSKILNRIIIGPCETPLPIRNALGFAIDVAGVPSHHDKIWMSFIPLRHDT